MTAMRPYSLYLPEDCISRLKEFAKERKTAAFVRDAIVSALDNTDAYQSGYSAAVRDAVKVINNCRHLDIISVEGRPLADIIAEEILSNE